MSNSTTVPISTKLTTEDLIVSYHSLTLIIVGTILNSLTFLILCRKRFRATEARPTLHYMRAVAIFDILMLYGWNLDHYLSPIHRFRILGYSIFTCRFFSFLSYFGPQSSAWLRVFISFDRFMCFTYLHRTWFSKSKSVLIIIATTMIILFILNCHFFMFVCFYRPNGVISALSWLYNIYPMWDYIHLGVYNFAPFLFMTLLNSAVIYHLIRLRRTSTVQNARIRHQAMSITLLITTFLFLLMTVPATMAFAFFSDADITILRFLDGILYTYHILGFPIYMITFDEFRREFISLITCRSNVQVAPRTRQTGRQ